MDWSHLRTIIWLRWRLSRNQWSRGGAVNLTLTMVIVALGAIVGLAGAIVGLWLGGFPLAKVPPVDLLGIWDTLVAGFLFFWILGLIAEIQRSEMLDIGRMLHLPIHLRDIFVVNYIASHLTVSLILFVPGMLGLCLGLTLSRGPIMLALLPVVLGLIFMVTAWTYCLRGYLVTLMSNPRRRRAVIAGITFTFIVIAQLPNILIHLSEIDEHKGPGIKAAPPTGLSEQTQVEPADTGGRRLPGYVLTAHKVVPFLWVGNGAMSLAQGHCLPALLGAAGAFGLGTLGLRRAYRSTVRFYQGQTTPKVSKSSARSVSVAPTGRSRLLAWRIPWLSEGASAMALATFRSMTRASEVKMMLATNFVMLLIFGGMVFMRRAAGISQAFEGFLATGVVVVTFFGMSQLMFNLFGFDRSGFRSLVLLPVSRDEVLLGKNLALLPAAVTIGAILLALVTFFVSLSIFIVLGTVLQLLSAFLMLSIIGNLFSILVPYHIAPGSMKATKVSTTTTFLLVASRLLFPVAMVPIFLVPGLSLLFSKYVGLSAGPANFLLSMVLLALVVLAYRLSLSPLGRLLQRREMRILQIVTQEVE